MLFDRHLYGFTPAVITPNINIIIVVLSNNNLKTFFKNHIITESVIIESLNLDKNN